MREDIKDPDSVLDYQNDWSAWLNGDVIMASQWFADPGIHIDSDLFTPSATTVWLSGGEIGASYRITNRITTGAGRIDERTRTIVVKDK